MTVTLVPDGGGTEIVYPSKIWMAMAPMHLINISGSLAAGVTYNGSIELLNETESPAEDITEEVKEEDLDHQFFYTVGTGLDVTTAYSEEWYWQDRKEIIWVSEFTLTAGAVSSGTLTFTLRHEPNKPNTGLSDAEGETDIEVAFDIEVSKIDVN